MLGIFNLRMVVLRRCTRTHPAKTALPKARQAVMLPLSVLSTVPDATPAAAAAAAAVADAATAAAAAAVAAAVAPMARLKLVLPTGSPFAGGTPVTIQFRWERSTNLTGSEPPACRFGQVHTAAQLLGDSTLLTTPAAYGTLPAQSLLCHALQPECRSWHQAMILSLVFPAPMAPAVAVCGARGARRGRRSAPWAARGPPPTCHSATSCTQAPACTSPRCLPQGKVRTVRRLS